MISILQSSTHAAGVMDSANDPAADCRPAPFSPQTPNLLNPTHLKATLSSQVEQALQAMENRSASKLGTLERVTALIQPCLLLVGSLVDTMVNIVFSTLSQFKH